MNKNHKDLQDDSVRSRSLLYSHNTERRSRHSSRSSNSSRGSSSSARSTSNKARIVGLLAEVNALEQGWKVESEEVRR